MIKEKAYYQYITRRLVESNPFFSKYGFSEYNDIYILPQDSKLQVSEETLKQIKSKFDFDLLKMAKANELKFSLWQKEFSCEEDNYAKIIATEFVLFCCLCDKILDSKRFSTDIKTEICRRLNDFPSEEHIIGNYTFYEIDCFYKDITCWLRSLGINEKKYSSIMTKIINAFQSEIYMYKNTLSGSEDYNQRLMIDKSTEFVSGAFLISTINTDDEKMIETANVVANIFWLTDDICDFMDDIQCDRKNSLLVICVPGKENLTLDERVDLVELNIDKAINYFYEELSRLERLVSKDLFLYFLNEIWDWTYDIRRRR